MTRTFSIFATAALVAYLLACGGSANQPNTQAGESRVCAGQERVMLDCSSEVAYQGGSGEAKIDIGSLVDVGGKFERTAIRRVSEQVASYVAAQTRACRDYNACILSPAQYGAEATETRRRLTALPALIEAIKSATSESERLRALDYLYRGIVPEAARTEEVTFRMAMVAKLPDELGGGAFSLPPGGAVPTGAQVHFVVDVSVDAYLYMFQSTPSGEVTVLFPDARIGTRNPLAGGRSGRIPRTQTFRVNESDIGTEQLYVVVSRKPLQDLDRALELVRSGEITSLEGDTILSTLSTVAPPTLASRCKGSVSLREGKSRGLALAKDTAKPACRRPRALELDPAAESESIGGVSPQAMRVRTRPGDDLIVSVHPFEHLTLAAYRKQAKTGALNKRGIMLEE